MSAAAQTTAPLPPSRSGRLLALVRNLIGYGRQLAATLHQRAIANDTSDLARRFGTANLAAILGRIALGLHRARLLEERVVRTAARLDAEPRPKPAPSPRAPRPASPQAEPGAPARPQPQLARLPTIDQLAAKIRRQPIGRVLADICRDLGITRGHPLWDELHFAIDEYGGNACRLFMHWLNRAYPIAHIVARLKADRAATRAPAGTGPPRAVSA